MLALVRDNQMVERRDLATEAIPAHKRYLWRPIVFDGDGKEVETTVHADRVVIRREPAPVAPVAPAPAPDDTRQILAAVITKMTSLEQDIDGLRRVMALLSEAAKQGG